jgi:SAM-dependent methyltransferase
MEIDLLTKYPKRTRDTKARKKEKTKKIIELARKFGYEYFDEPGVCYGTYKYDGRWIPVVRDMIEHFDLKPGAKILDVGCAKGHTVYDFIGEGMNAFGIDISTYAIENCMPQVKDRVRIANAKDLSMFKDKEFDLVISINSIHNLDEKECREAVKEIQRVGKKGYIVVDSWRNEYEKERMLDWNIAGRTVLSSDDWKKLFEEEGYTGDYYWFIP